MYYCLCIYKLWSNAFFSSISCNRWHSIQCSVHVFELFCDQTCCIWHYCCQALLCSGANHCQERSIYPKGDWLLQQVSIFTRPNLLLSHFMYPEIRQPTWAIFDRWLSWIHWNRFTIQGFVVYELKGLKEMKKIGCCLWFLCSLYCLIKVIVVNSVLLGILMAFLNLSTTTGI